MLLSAIPLAKRKLLQLFCNPQTLTHLKSVKEIVTVIYVLDAIREVFLISKLYVVVEDLLRSSIP